MIIDQLTAIPSPQGTDELPIERGTLTYKITYDDLVGDAINELETDIGDVSTLSGFTATDLTGAANELNSKTDTFVRPNLLVNWYFVGGGSQQGGGQFPINQRGQTSYSGVVNGFDRWIGNASAQISLVSSGCNVTGSLQQRIEKSLLPSGATLTLTILYDGGLRTYTFTNDGSNHYSTDSDNIQFGLRISTNYNIIEFACSAQKKLYAAKLELGNTQTLAHQVNGVWVLNAIPSYQQELAKCQRYFLKLGGFTRIRASLVTSNSIQFFVPTPTSMRTEVDANIGGSPIIESIGGVSQSGFTVSVLSQQYDGVSSTGVIISASKSSHGLTDAIFRANGATISVEL